VRWVTTECSWNDGSKTQYYVVILDRLQGRSGGLEWAPELRIRGPLIQPDIESIDKVYSLPFVIPPLSYYVPE